MVARLQVRHEVQQAGQQRHASGGGGGGGGGAEGEGGVVRAENDVSEWSPQVA